MTSSAPGRRPKRPPSSTATKVDGERKTSDHASGGSSSRSEGPPRDTSCLEPAPWPRRTAASGSRTDRRFQEEAGSGGARPRREPKCRRATPGAGRAGRGVGALRAQKPMETVRPEMNGPGMGTALREPALRRRRDDRDRAVAATGRRADRRERGPRAGSSACRSRTTGPRAAPGRGGERRPGGRSRRPGPGPPPPSSGSWASASRAALRRLGSSPGTSAPTMTSGSLRVPSLLLDGGLEALAESPRRLAEPPGVRRAPPRAASGEQTTSCRPAVRPASNALSRQARRRPTLEPARRRHPAEDAGGRRPPSPRVKTTRVGDGARGHRDSSLAPQRAQAKERSELSTWHRIVAPIVSSRMGASTLRDHVAFLAGFLRAPWRVGAIAPSSRALAAVMTEDMGLEEARYRGRARTRHRGLHPGHLRARAPRRPWSWRSRSTRAWWPFSRLASPGCAS